MEEEVCNVCPQPQAKTQGEVKQIDLMRLVESQQYRCGLSGIELTPETAALDHIVPLASGGSHAIDNLQWLNCEVNRMKGSLSSEVFIDICRRVTVVADQHTTATPPPAKGTSPS